MSLFGLGRNQRTFRPKKIAPSGSKGTQLRQHIDATLGSGNLREAVRLPPGEDLNEWLAVNTVDFFNQVNLLYGTLTEFCTPESCRTMTAGPKILSCGLSECRAGSIDAPFYGDLSGVELNQHVQPPEFQAVRSYARDWFGYG